MEIRLIKSSKRKNSLEIPSGGSSHEATLKGGSSIISPTLMIKTNSDDYNMVYMNGRYYWISDWQWVRDDLAQLRCTVDPLASWRSEILQTSAYVLYSSSDYDHMIPDNRIMTRNTVSSNNWIGDNILVFNSEGSYIVGVIGKPNRPSVSGMTTVYSLTARQCSDLAVAFSEDDAIKQLINEYGAAWDALIFSRWIPVAVEPGATSPISIANVNTGIQGKQIEQRYVSTTFQIKIPWAYRDFRMVEPYCNASIYLPFVGVVDVSLSELQDQEYIHVDCAVDKYTGDIIYKIGASRRQYAVYSGSCAVEIPINSYQRDWKGVVQGGVSTLMEIGKAALQGAQAAGAAMAGMPASGPSMDGVVGNFMNTLNSYFTFNTGNKGGFSGGCATYLGYKPMMTVFAHETSIPPSEMRALYGRPCGAVKQMSSLSGFVQTAEFKVAGTMTDVEKGLIENFMRGGVYIE